VSGIWARALVYLGLRDEEDDLYVGHGGGEADPRRADDDRRRSGGTWSDDERGGSARDDRGSRRGGRDVWEEPRARDRRSPLGHDLTDSGRIAAIGGDNVHKLPVQDAPRPNPSFGASVRIVHVTTFDDCEAIGVRYRDRVPVLFDIGSTDAPTGRRVLDFVSGMTFAAHGRMRKVGRRSFLVVPDGVALAREEQKRLEELGYDVPSDLRS